MLESCATCRFFRKWDERVNGGDCRLKPPAFVPFDPRIVEGDTGCWKYPPMEDEGWCGEYRAKGVANG